MAQLAADGELMLHQVDLCAVVAVIGPDEFDGKPFVLPIVHCLPDVAMASIAGRVEQPIHAEIIAPLSHGNGLTFSERTVFQRKNRRIFSLIALGAADNRSPRLVGQTFLSAKRPQTSPKRLRENLVASRRALASASG